MNAPKETGVLFQSAMVLAMQDGLKTQTRRPIKPQPDRMHSAHPYWNIGGYRLSSSAANPLPCPYGAAGDRIWVKETFYAWGRWVLQLDDDKERDAWHFVDMTLAEGHAYRYVAGGRAPSTTKRTAAGAPAWWKRPAIFMPRAACRLVLDVTETRAERLQAIGEYDALAEGARFHNGHGVGHSGWRHDTGSVHATAREAYARLWNAINGAEGPTSWAADPWVWAVSFKVAGDADQA